MSKITKELSNIHEMLTKMHLDLGLVDLNPTEKFIFLKIINEIETNNTCSMLKAVEVADKSRSTVYKTIRKLVKIGVLKIENSNDDKRWKKVFETKKNPFLEINTATCVFGIKSSIAIIWTGSPI